MSDDSTRLPQTMKEAILDASWDDDSHAIESVDGRVMTYGRLRSKVRWVVGMLNRAGYRKGDRFATVLNNGPEQFAVLVALMSGFIVVPMNPNFKEEEFARYMKGARVKAVVLDGGPSCPASAVARSLGIEVYELIKEGPAGVLDFSLKGRGSDEKPKTDPEFSDEGDICTVFGTSGTTARPKLVPLTQSNVLWGQHFYRRCHRDSQSDRCLAFLPIFYAHGLIAPLRALFYGGCVIYTPAFDPRQFYSWLELSRATWMTAGPTNYQAILEHAGENAGIIARSRLRYISTGNAMMPAVVMERLERLFGAPVQETYAMTEAGIITVSPAPPAKVKRGSAGVSWGTEVAIMGWDGNLLPRGELGEIVIRGKVVMAGYENDPEANAEAFKNGWFRTGDIGYMDDEGYLFIKGRQKDIINRGGEKVAPQEVEEALLAHPAVREAVVFSVKHPKLGEDIAAAVVLGEGSNVSEGELRVHVSKKLAFFKVPSRVLVVGALPKGATGKISRAGMAESLGLTKGGWGKSEYQPPKTDAERRLVRLLEGIFPGVQIGVKDNFFDLGGYSLMAVRLFNEIEKEFGLRLPLSTLFQCPTVEEMARVLEGGGRDVRWKSLVPLQTSGSKPPLFLIHGGDGDLYNYRELVKALGDGRKIYGLQARGLDGREEPVEDIGEMVDDYLGEILGVDPVGPYYLMGFSGGGVIAFELARQLVGRGRKVAYVGVIDMEIPSDDPETLRRNVRKSFFREAFFLAKDLMPNSRKRKRRADLKLGKRMRILMQSGLYGVGAFNGDFSMLMAADAAILPEARKRVWQAQIRALLKYKPMEYPGRLTIFQGEGIPLVYPSFGKGGWDRYAKGGIDLHVVPGRLHGSQLRSPNVEYLATLANRAMDNVASAK